MDNFRGVVKNLNNPLKVMIRLGIAVPLLLTLIIVWAYFIIFAAEPLVDEDRSQPPQCDGLPVATCNTTHNCQWNKKGDSGECIPKDGLNTDGLGIFDAFCNAQTTSGVSGGGVTAQGAIGSRNRQCDVPLMKYNCDGTIDDPVIPGRTYTPGICPSNKVLDTTKNWCDISNASISSNFLQYCCVDNVYEDNINSFGLIIYFIITIPIIFLLIEKIINGFIIVDEPIYKAELTNQFGWLGGYISENGLKLVLILLVAHFILMPIVRFFIVSYKCEDITSTSTVNCNKNCDADSDCATLHGNGCTVCKNNVCEQPVFTDDDTDAEANDIDVSVCSIKDIVTYLKDEEINDIANQFGMTNTVSGISDYITQGNADSLATPGEREKEITSYYYKFYPRQELYFNDTSEPFRTRLPNPDIQGFNYLLNNYIQLDEYTNIACTSDNMEECNINHNCKWTGTSCDIDECTKRYKLPRISAINATQNLDDGLSLHDKVYRQGIDYSDTTKFDDNLYPCSNVVVDRTLKQSIESNLNNIKGTDNVENVNLLTIDDTDLNAWATELELKKIECADKNGQCYMKDHVCETSNGAPIPIKWLEDTSSSDQLTIPEFSNDGCKNAMYPCGNLDESCTIIKEDNGYLVELPDEGTCKSVNWRNNSWIEDNSAANINSVVTRCVPNDPSITEGNIIPSPLPTAKIATWIPQNSPNDIDADDITSSCKSVNRMPITPIDAAAVPADFNYYRWNTASNADYKMCHEWFSEDASHLCPTGKTDNRSGRFRNINGDPLTECCLSTDVSDGNVSLYIGGADGQTPDGGHSIVGG